MPNRNEATNAERCLAHAGPLAAENPRYPEQFAASYHLQAAQGEAMRRVVAHGLLAIVEAINMQTDMRR